MKNKRLWKGLTGVLCVLLAILIPATALAKEWEGSINSVLGITESESVGGQTIYGSKFGELNDTNFKKFIEAANAQVIYEAEEGAVLLENKGGLPLGEGERKVTLFGRASADPIYRGSSAGPEIDEDRLINLYDGLKNAGFTINDTLYNAYLNSSTKREAGNIGEEPKSFYTESIKGTYAQFSDVAIVVLSRYGGEGRDLSTKDAEGISQLAIHQSERDMFEMIESAGCFKKVIVLLNSGYPMELDWLNDYKIDACLWVGNPGLLGFAGVANILTGKVNPSGRVADTYAANSLSSAAVQNFGDFEFTNGGKYVVQLEGIYYGYKYYETRYEDIILNRFNANSKVGTFASKGNWNYADEIVYPFGYGLSYTTFEQTLDSLEYDATNRTYTAKVTVKNTGSVAGKDVVQVYVGAPYTEYNIANKIEKSAIQLVQFGKTGLIAPGESETLTLEIDQYLCASYDNVTQGYILDKGTYYFAIGDNAHDALNNVLFAKGASGMYDEDGKAVSGDSAQVKSWDLELDGDKKFDDFFATSQYTGEKMKNQLDDADINYWYDKDVATYLTRSDWNTFPKPLTGLTATDAMVKEMSDEDRKMPAGVESASKFKQGIDSGLALYDMIGVDWDDPKWEQIINQMSLADMAKITADGCGLTGIKSIGKPKNIWNDGPDGYKGTYKYGGNKPCTTYANESVLACTWSQDVLTKRGEFLAEETLWVGANLMWAPGANLHRTPFSGRNHEYYSEDANFNYLCLIPEVKAMQANGTVSSLKHFVANDQETNRSGIATFSTEQGLRQCALRGMEGAFTEGGALGTMTAYNRIGCTASPAHRAINTNILRGEWGFKGATITDASASKGFHVRCLVAGTDFSNLYTGSEKEILDYLKANDDGEVHAALRETAKRALYLLVNSNFVNKLSKDVVVESDTSPWLVGVYVFDVVVGVAALGSLAMLVLNEFVWKKKED